MGDHEGLGGCHWLCVCVCEGIVPGEGHRGLPRARGRKSLQDSKVHVHMHADMSHTSVSLPCFLSNSLQQELAGRTWTLSSSGKGRGFGWPQLELASKLSRLVSGRALVRDESEDPEAAREP